MADYTIEREAREARRTAMIGERFRSYHLARETGTLIRPKPPGEIYFFFVDELEHPQILQEASPPTPYRATVQGIGLKEHGKRRVMTPLFGEQKDNAPPLTGTAYPGIRQRSGEIIRMLSMGEKCWFVDVTWVWIQLANGETKKAQTWLCVHLE